MPTGIVTGASRGLGRALAQTLVGEGWSLVVDARKADDLRDAVTELGEAVTAVTGDVADATHREELVSAARGRLDLVINNASVLGPSPQPRLDAYPLGVLEYVYRVNALAPLGLIQAALPKMGPGARIVNITSNAGAKPFADWGGYGSSKAALEMLSAVLAVEHPDLRVYAVDPGNMRTRMHQAAYPDRDLSDLNAPEEVAPRMLRLVAGSLASGRYVVPEL